MVLLHALGERADDWDVIAERLAERHRVISLDLRGHGASDWPGEYSFELMRDDVVGLLDNLSLQRVTFMGHSMGGMAAYLLAMTSPSRVERLIIEDAPPPFRRSRGIPDRPAEPIDFDWAAAPAIIGQVNAGDPVAWEGLSAITAPTLLIGGGDASHIPQAKLDEAAALIPQCDRLTIEAGHNVHASKPDEFADAVLDWLSR